MSNITALDSPRRYCLLRIKMKEFMFRSVSPSWGQGRGILCVYEIKNIAAT